MKKQMKAHIGIFSFAFCFASISTAENFKSLDTTPIPGFGAKSGYDPVGKQGVPPVKGEGAPPVPEGKQKPVEDMDEVEDKKKKLSPEEEAEEKGWETFSSVVNAVRRTDRTEVMFRNGESYYLPSGGKHNEYFQLCQDSEAQNTAVSVTVNPVSRVIVTMSGATAKKKRAR